MCVAFVFAEVDVNGTHSRTDYSYFIDFSICVLAQPAPSVLHPQNNGENCHDFVSFEHFFQIIAIIFIVLIKHFYNCRCNVIMSRGSVVSAIVIMRKK